jgi:hypothetical protein
VKSSSIVFTENTAHETKTPASTRLFSRFCPETRANTRLWHSHLLSAAARIVSSVVFGEIAWVDANLDERGFAGIDRALDCGREFCSTLG